jgi:hypothetical protein
VRAAAAATGDLDTGFFAAEHEACGLSLEPLARPDHLGQILARAAAAFFGARLVDFVGSFGGVGQDEDLIARDLQEAATDRHDFLDARFFDPHDTRMQGGQQWRVARQNAHHPFSARRHDHVDAIFGQHFPFGGDDLYP